MYEMNLSKSSFSRIRIKIGKVCLKILDVLFAILAVVILFSTLLYDKNIQNPFPNIAKYSNGGYYFIAFTMLCSIVWAFSNVKRVNMPEKVFYSLFATVALITLAAQTIVAFWAPDVYVGSDFRNVQEMAIKLTQGDITWNDYFSISPNNTHIAILLSWVYGIADNWRLVVWMGAVLTNLSSLLSGLTIYHITKNKRVSIIILIFSEFLIGMSWRSYLAYTDNWGMPFVAIMLYIFTSNIKSKFKVPLIMIFGLVGAWIKVTVLIPLMGIGTYILLKALIEKELKFKKTSIFSFILCIALIIGAQIINASLLDRYNYTQSDSAKGVSYFFMVGQDESGLGTCGGQEFGKIYGEIYAAYSNKSERMNACFRTALGWIKERGVLGNIGYYLKKVNVAYNDGYFHNVQPYDKNLVAKNCIYEFYSDDGKYYILCAEIMQVIWDLILILITSDIIFCLLRKKENFIYSVFKISILAITLYLMIFEGRSKYLFMFLPIYIAYAGLRLNELLIYIKYISKINNKGSEPENGSDKIQEIKKLMKKNEQFIKFAIVGCSNTLISLTIYYFCIFLGIHYILSYVLGFLASVCNAFFWNNKYVFKNKQEKNILKAFAKATVSYGFSFLLSLLLMSVFVELLGISSYIAPIFKMIITIPLNFILNKVWAFKEKVSFK